MNPVEYFRSAFTGTPQARSQLLQALAAGADIGSGVAELQRLCPGDAGRDPEAPVFLLSAGWRSGSTMLQRLIMSDPRVLLWGEPFDECGPVQAMAGMVRAFRSGWPPPDYYISHHGNVRPVDLTDDWIANLFPAPETIRASHRAYFDAAYSAPARRAGCERWGIKEVRLTVDHARYLKWLYPNATFVFLYRDPFAAYRSYCRFGRNWYDLFPHQPMFTPAAFGRHWRELLLGFMRADPSLGGLLVRYEDLVAGKPDVLQRIERHLDLRLDASILGQKVGTSERGGRKARVSWLERTLLQRAVAPLAEELGYAW